MLFGLWARIRPRNYVLDGVQISPWERAILSVKGGPFTLQSIGTLCRELCWTDRDGLVEDFGWARGIKHAHWRHLANTTELSMCGGMRLFCEITLPPLVIRLIIISVFGNTRVPARMSNISIVAACFKLSLVGLISSLSSSSSFFISGN